MHPKQAIDLTKTLEALLNADFFHIIVVAVIFLTAALLFIVYQSIKSRNAGQASSDKLVSQVLDVLGTLNATLANMPALWQQSMAGVVTAMNAIPADTVDALKETNSGLMVRLEKIIEQQDLAQGVAQALPTTVAKAVTAELQNLLTSLSALQQVADQNAAALGKVRTDVSTLLTAMSEAKSE